MIKPAYNAKTGATTGNSSAEYDAYLRSLNEPQSSAFSNPTSNIIPAGDLNGNTKQPTLPPNNTNTVATGLEGYIENGNNTVKTEADRLRTERENIQASNKGTLDKTLSEIMGTNNEIANAGNTIDRSAQDAAKKQADQYTSQIESEALATRRAIENLRKNNPEGLFGGALEQKINQIQTDSTSKQADLAILQNSALRNYDTASAIADRQLQLKLEPLKAKVENLKFFYENNKADFNREDDRLYSEAVKKADREYNKEEAIQTDIKGVKLEAAKNGAPASIIQAIGNAKTLTEALKAAGRYNSDPLDRAIKQAQLSKLTSSSSGEAPTIKSINGVDMQWDGSKWVTPSAGSTTGGDPTTIEKGIDEIKAIKQLAGDKLALNASAGIIQRGNNSLINRNRIADWRASAGNVLSKLTVTELARIKNTGVTFGALSEGERNAVAGAASVLNEAKIYKGTGENKVWTGRFSISENLVRKSLNDIQKYAEIDFKKRTGYLPDEYVSRKYAEDAQNALESPETMIGSGNYDLTPN